MAVPVTIPYVRYSIESAQWWIGRALKSLVENTGIKPRDIDGFCVSSFTAGLDSGIGLAQHFGLCVRWVDTIPLGGASAIAALRRAVELDPRNINFASALALTYVAVRHFSDALVIADHILTVDPTNASGIGIKTFNLLAMGDLEAAEAMVANPHTDVEARGYYAMIKRRYAEVVDILGKGLNDKSDQEKARLFLDIGLAQQRAGNVAAARTAYQQAAQEFQRELGKAAPDAGPAAELHSNLGVAYAGLSDAASAVAEGQKGMVMQPSSEDPFEGPGREAAMAKIYALLGDADHAIPILKRLVQTSAPTEIVPALLRLDPIWDSIRNDPRFQELVAEKKP